MPRPEQIAKPSKTSSKNPKQLKRGIRTLEPEMVPLKLQKSSDTNSTVKSKKSAIKSSKGSDDIDSDKSIRLSTSDEEDIERNEPLER